MTKVETKKALFCVPLDILLGKSFSLSEDVQYEIGVFINRYYLTNKRRS